MPCNKEALLKRLKKLSLNIQVKDYTILSHRVLRFYANTRTIFVVFVLGNGSSVGVAESSNATKLFFK